MNRPTALLVVALGVACGALGAFLAAYRACNRALDGLRF